MRFILAITSFVILCGTLTSVSALAANSVRYVNDDLIITLRAGQGNQYKILKSLPTGTRLELLEAGDGEFAKVRTAEGIEGWVTSWYLSETPPAQMRLPEVEKKAARLADENKQLQSGNAELKKRIDELQGQLNQSETKSGKLLSENNSLKDIASRPIELENANKQLSVEIATLREDNQRLDNENRELRANEMQKWFLVGCGVLVLGILLGLILPRLRRQRDSGWA